MWKRPGSSNDVSTRLVDKSNQFVDVDPLFGEAHIVCHLIDGCNRWTGSGAIPNTTTTTIPSKIKQVWFSHWMAPECFISDEGALGSTEGHAFCEKRGHQL